MKKRDIWSLAATALLAVAALPVAHASRWPNRWWEWPTRTHCSPTRIPN